MIDPEVEHRRLVSGDPAALRDAAEALRSTVRSIDRAREEIDAAGETVAWTGSAATAFRTRLAGLAEGAATTASILVQARGAIETAAAAYATVLDHADHYISFWRNRPPALPALFEDLLARQVNGFLVQVGRTYQEQLAAVVAVLKGEEVDPDELDEDTREWVERGLARNEEWLEHSSSGLGPMIPNTAATGDDRAWIPQGLGYDPATRSLLQAYYTKDGSSSMAVIDEVSGKEVGEVTLGSDYYDAAGQLVDGGAPSHAGGVTVDGDRVYVSDNGTIHTYSLSEIRAAAPGSTVPQAAAPQPVRGGSYTAFHEGRLYCGDFGKNTLHVYEPGPGGSWVEVDTVSTPDHAQGVVVRDGSYVFSTSSGRHNESSLIAQDATTGERGEPYPLPHMSQGVVEVDGELVTSYESGAGEFSDPGSGGWGWVWGVPDGDGLWANPYMTRTPLSELGLVEEVEVEPGSLHRAAADLEAPASALDSSAGSVDEVRIGAASFGPVPAAAELAGALTSLLAAAGQSLRTGADAVRLTGESLDATATGYRRTDDAVGGVFTALDPF